LDEDEDSAKKDTTSKKIESSFKSFSLGSVTCPKCERVGQLKERMTRRGIKYFQIDHYKIGNRHSSGYFYSCYLRCAEEGEYSLETQNQEHRKILRRSLVGEENLGTLLKPHKLEGKKDE